MPPPKKKASTLGKAIMRRRFGGAQKPNENSTLVHTTDLNDGPKWVKLKSVTQETDLDEFLNTALLAGTEFTAERQNITVVANTHMANLYLPTPEEETEVRKRHQQHKSKLTVPRRPAWDKDTTPEELQRNERESFLNWRRGLAVVEEEQNLILTPFERNLEVWRQLWRVLERSDIVVQIVDARNPLLFRSTDLDVYVNELNGGRKKSLLLVNKADMLSAKQRRQWAEYFDANNIRYTFFSAMLEKKKLEDEEKRKTEKCLFTFGRLLGEPKNEDAAEEELIVAEKWEEEEMGENSKERENEGVGEQRVSLGLDAHDDDDECGLRVSKEIGNGGEHDVDERTRIRSSVELFELFLSCAPSEEERCDPKHLTVGLVGYPNVGKSSTINALAGAKRVSVSSTPGKTKHFQTLHLTPDLVICDCPGLVFPTFATSKADLVCNGILPIDQLREWTGPVALVGRRVPKYVIEKVYGIDITVLNEEDGGDGVATAAELSSAYAVARGYYMGGRSGSAAGNPDQSRAARYILKDFVNGKLLYTHPPPGVNAEEYNAELYDPRQWARAPRRREADDHPASMVPEGLSTSERFDSSFFRAVPMGVSTTGKFARVGDFSRVKLFPHQGVASAAAENGKNGKRHKKPKKHVKHRSGEGY